MVILRRLNGSNCDDFKTREKEGGFQFWLSLWNENSTQLLLSRANDIESKIIENQFCDGRLTNFERQKGNCLLITLDIRSYQKSMTLFLTGSAMRNDGN